MRKPKTPCRKCGTPIPNPGWCKTCKPRARAQIKRASGFDDYGSEYQRMRKLVIQQEPWCRCPGCGIKCCLNRAETTQVDHILALRDGGTHARSNLRGMCAPCHARKTRADGRRRF